MSERSDVNAKPTISVVVPLYNKSGHVLRAIDAVRRQTLQDFEIVVIDDGSTDDGPALVEAVADPRIRLHRQPNAGVSAARNAGVARARADVVAFLDADDAYRPDFLANIVALREAHPGAGGWAMNYAVVGPDGATSPGVANVPEATLSLDVPTFVRLGKYASPVFSSSVAVDRVTLERAGGFPVGVRLGEDIDTWLRICALSPIAFDRRMGGVYHLDADDRAVRRNAPPERYVFFDTIDRWAATQRDLPTAVEADIREFKNFFSLVYARFEIRWGRPTAGRRVLRSMRTRDFAQQRQKLLLASFLPQGLHGLLGATRA